MMTAALICAALALGVSVINLLLILSITSRMDETWRRVREDFDDDG